MKNVMLLKPHNLRRKNPLRLILLMGLVGICFILAANAMIAVAVLPLLPLASG